MFHALASVLIASASSTFVVTEDMLKPLQEGITANIGVILPWGLAIFAIILVVTLIPRLIKKFTHA